MLLAGIVSAIVIGTVVLVGVLGVLADRSGDDPETHAEKKAAD
jgi:hypothetical protein